MLSLRLPLLAHSTYAPYILAPACWARAKKYQTLNSDELLNPSPDPRPCYCLLFRDEVEAAGLMPKLDDMLTRIQEIHDLDIPPGYNPDLR